MTGYFYSAELGARVAAATAAVAVVDDNGDGDNFVAAKKTTEIIAQRGRIRVYTCD